LAVESPFPIDLLARILPEVTLEWENDGLRVLESSLQADQLQLTLSTTPQVAPITLAGRVKGRIQHHCRLQGIPLAFSRKLAVRSLWDPTRAQVEAYIRDQVLQEALADESYREQLKPCTVIQPKVDLALPTASNSGRYRYNLHLVLVTNARYRVTDVTTLARIRDATLRICAKKGYAASRLAVMPDHLHLAVRGAIAQSPEEMALSFLNNLAYILGQRPWWQPGYYAGTFGEYSMAAVRRGGLGADGREKE
jgi:REP element-mobilizing transposase RayT